MSMGIGNQLQNKCDLKPQYTLKFLTKLRNVKFPRFLCHSGPAHLSTTTDDAANYRPSRLSVDIIEFNVILTDKSCIVFNIVVST